MMNTSPELKTQIQSALTKVIDPEIKKPITELDMVKEVTVDEDHNVTVEILLTVPGCPLKDEINSRIKHELSQIEDIKSINIVMSAMSDEQRTALKQKLQGGNSDPVIPFSKPNSLTKVFAIASGKGGVGKSSVTVNLAAAAAVKGLSVGIVDADIYGHSVPGLLGTTDYPTKLDNMIIPPVAHDMKVISIDQFTKGNTPVIWRGPMLHRALQQFLADVFWGDLDVLFLDLPPGTGDMALSVAQLLPNAELIIVTTPQMSAAKVAERAGAIATQTRQRIAGVIENMSAFTMPDGTVLDIFGSGGGQEVADNLSKLLGTTVPLLGSIPLDPSIRIAGDAGIPQVISNPQTESSQTIKQITDQILEKSRGIVGKPLGLNTVRH